MLQDLDIKKPLNLYVHMPFCRQKCAYCAFYSIPSREDFVDKYILSVEKEISELKDRLSSYIVKTIYIGGGTPSILNEKQLNTLFSGLRNNLRIVDFPEISFEVNPESADVNTLRFLYKLGVNRLSIGLQAWQDTLLKQMNRLHSQRDFLNTYTRACEIGFRNINVDTIFGYPGQTLDQWKETLEQVCRLKPEHISCYSLEIDNKSRLAMEIKLGKQGLPSEDTDRKMSHWTSRKLETHGYMHYEISNYAKPGYECQHNSDFWHHQEYIGIGVAAHSFMDSKHFHHNENIQEYMANPLHYTEDSDLTLPDRKLEWLLLHFRLISGFNETDYYQTFSSNLFMDFNHSLQELIENKLIYKDGLTLRCSEKGLDLYNYTMSKLAMDAY